MRDVFLVTTGILARAWRREGSSRRWLGLASSGLALARFFTDLGSAGLYGDSRDRSLRSRLSLASRGFWWVVECRSMITVVSGRRVDYCPSVVGCGRLPLLQE